MTKKLSKITKLKPKIVNQKNSHPAQNEKKTKRNLRSNQKSSNFKAPLTNFYKK